MLIWFLSYVIATVIFRVFESLLISKALSKKVEEVIFLLILQKMLKLNLKLLRRSDNKLILLKTDSTLGRKI